MGCDTDWRGLDLGTTTLDGLDRSLAIDGVSESINDTTEHAGTDGDVDNVSGTLDGVALLTVNDQVGQRHARSRRANGRKRT
jgi:hypothetical protein